MIPPGCPSRRSLLRLGALGVALAPGVLVAACSSSAGSGDAGTATVANARVPAADVPVGQARVVDAGGQRLVVAQPSEGEFVAFSATCTHQGGHVEADDGGLVVTCLLHGSRFDTGDGGAVLNGPATAPLPSVAVALERDELVVG